MKTGKALLGVLVGLAAGAVLGLIFASDKESEVIKSNERLSDTLSKYIGKKFDEFEGKFDKIGAKPDRHSPFSRKAEMN
ncbi:MAG TPA: YtxH domain-containing protein [Chryseosolibacter sp.]|nr:YtxH domain-containing protein [Chryseosolibacter sp.]